MTATVLEHIQLRFQALKLANEDLYEFLNQFRDWFNVALANYEIFLEDNWFDGKTTLEYTLRCLDTFNIVVFAEDEYRNFRDTQTWHLGPYVRSYWVVDDPWETIVQFINNNTVPRLHDVTLP